MITFKDSLDIMEFISKRYKVPIKHSMLTDGDTLFNMVLKAGAFSCYGCYEYPSIKICVSDKHALNKIFRYNTFSIWSTNSDRFCFTAHTHAHIFKHKVHLIRFLDWLVQNE